MGCNEKVILVDLKKKNNSIHGGILSSTRNGDEREIEFRGEIRFRIKNKVGIEVHLHPFNMKLRWKIAPPWLDSMTAQTTFFCSDLFLLVSTLTQFANSARTEEN